MNNTIKHPNFVLLLFSFFAFQCNPSNSSNDKTVPFSFSKKDNSNQLSEKEISSGWELLFDGKTYHQWETFQGDTLSSRVWSVNEEGSLVKERVSESIVTKRVFENFDFRIEFKISNNSDLGIFYRISKDSSKLDFINGIEFQIIDPSAIKRAGDIPISKHITGDVYDLYDSKNKVDISIGKWHQARIVILNDFVEHWLDHQLILQYKIGSEEWESNVINSKFRKVKKYGKTLNSPIGIQCNDPTVQFRNIKIKVL